MTDIINLKSITKSSITYFLQCKASRGDLYSSKLSLALSLSAEQCSLSESTSRIISVLSLTHSSWGFFWLGFLKSTILSLRGLFGSFTIFLLLLISTWTDNFGFGFPVVSLKSLTTLTLTAFKLLGSLCSSFKGSFSFCNLLAVTLFIDGLIYKIWVECFIGEL